jgi:hypothetical protein
MEASGIKPNGWLETEDDSQGSSSASIATAIDVESGCGSGLEQSESSHQQEAEDGVGKAQRCCLSQPETERATTRQLERLAYEQGERCALSGRMIKPETADLDHIIALSNGGTNAIDNLHWLDRQVHKCKGTLDTNEFIRVCLDVAAWVSRKDL